MLTLKRRAVSKKIIIIAVIVAVAAASLGIYTSSVSSQITTQQTTERSSPPTTSTSQTSFYTSLSNSTDNLDFTLQLTPNSNGSLTIKVDEVNLLDSVNNVTGTNSWKYSQFSLNPFNNCAVNLFDGFAIAPGYYGNNNLTSASVLRLYDAADGEFSCSSSSMYDAYAFQPMSDVVTVDQGFASKASTSEAVSGYWTPSGSSFQDFPPGTYTVIGADQWGNILLMHFTVSTTGQFEIQSGTTTTA